MKSLKTITLIGLLIFSSQLFAQNGKSGLTIISEGGEIVTFISPHGLMSGPVVIQDNMILSTAGVDCTNQPDHANCQSPETLRDPFIEGEPGAPKVVWVDEFGVRLFTQVGPGDYPPPLVIIHGEITNRTEPTGQPQTLEFRELEIEFTSPDQHSNSTIILLDDQVLSPGGVDCNIEVEHPQCKSLTEVLGSLGGNQAGPPGVVVVDIGEGSRLYTIRSADYPPPLVIVDGCAVNFQDLWLSCR